MEGSSPCVCVQIISKEENRGMKTTEQLKERGVPVNEDKFKWTSSAVKDLEQIVKLLKVKIKKILQGRKGNLFLSTSRKTYAADWVLQRSK